MFSRSQAPTVVLNKILVSLETLKALPCKSSSRCLYKTKASWEVFCFVWFSESYHFSSNNYSGPGHDSVSGLLWYSFCFNVHRMWHDLPQKYSFILKHKWLWEYLKTNTINYDAFKLIKTCLAAVSIKTWDRWITCAWTSITCDCWGSCHPTLTFLRHPSAQEGLQQLLKRFKVSRSFSNNSYSTSTFFFFFLLFFLVPEFALDGPYSATISVVLGQQELEQECKGSLKTTKASYQSLTIITTFFSGGVSLTRSLLNWWWLHIRGQIHAYSFALISWGRQPKLCS